MGSRYSIPTRPRYSPYRQSLREEGTRGHDLAVRVGTTSISWPAQIFDAHPLVLLLASLDRSEHTMTQKWPGNPRTSKKSLRAHDCRLSSCREDMLSSAIRILQNLTAQWLPALNEVTRDEIRSLGWQKWPFAIPWRSQAHAYHGNAPRGARRESKAQRLSVVDGRGLIMNGAYGPPLSPTPHKVRENYHREIRSLSP